ncbi:MAG: phenylacetic acid degradation operon negative regulatory protein PaaX [Rubrivivax sp. SCN 71-131]|jgi:phenylacetic acid degradation operon negative regulatory protein|nr:MAG: phenylacetic acid degradation operon negative regulatory protein PaaX [Rubrivivax sp. SCN 71-131]
MPRPKDDPFDVLLARPSPKAKSLIFTVYGDAISHRGGNAALGSVIALLAPLGVNERTVRTSMHRLAVEGWLQPRASGRRSDYRLTESGARRVDAAHERIYRPQQRPWDGQWTIVALGLGALDAAARQRLLRELGWIGFGRLDGGVLLHPDPDEEALRALLAESGPRVLVLRGAAAAWVGADVFESLVQEGWDTARLAADYEAFLADFRPLWLALQREEAIAPERAFVVRTLLMHDYRRVLLRDPMLPDELMPRGWPGAAARALCRNLYRRVEAAAERHVEAVLETAEGPAPPPAGSYFERFGGLRSA